MNAVTVAIDCAWLVLAAYGMRIQWLALRYARSNWSVAKHLPLNGVLVLAHARLRSNAARLSIIFVNAAIGIIALLLALTAGVPVRPEPVWAAVVQIFIAVGFTVNEIVMVLIARLEVGAHRRLVKHGTDTHGLT